MASNSSYKRNKNREKCVDMGLYGFIPKELKKKYSICNNKSWNPFWIYLLNSTVNSANFHPNWAGLALLFNRNFFKYETIETHARTFFLVIILFIAGL